MNEQSITDRYTLADLEKWSQVVRDIDPPIRLGVFGDPVAHSLSPQMQNAALRAFQINMQYARFHIRANELRSALRFLHELESISPCRTRSRGYRKLTRLMNRGGIAAQSTHFGYTRIN